ncbi:MAG: protein translocase subunit SecF [Spirochaetales bacterium]|jgi:preprotein translocase subunit SecF|nr:protein translocase subunit SecF [Spirochaetales bacterium]
MRVFQFLKYGKLTIILSSLCIIAGIAAAIFQGGFNLGLDFQAGLSQDIRIEGVSAPIDQVREILADIEGVQIQEAGGRQEYVVKVKQQGSENTATFQEDMRSRILKALTDVFGVPAVRELQSEYVGPRFSSDLASQTVLLTVFALALIMLYCWFRFKLGYAIAAIVATIHDALIMVGVIGAFQLEVSTATIAAILTIIGYSLNDTIVIFDRVRENTSLMREQPFPLIINTSTSQSLSRTIYTSVTTLLAIIALYIFGSGDVKQFALNMIIGVVVGTYSSPFIACPVLNVWRRAADRRRRNKDSRKAPGSAPRAETVKSAETVQDSSSEESAPAPETPDQTLEAGKALFSRRMSREERKRKVKK